MPVFSSTRYSVFMGYRVKSYRSDIRDSPLLFGSPCSKHLEHASRCRPLTILKQMVRHNVQTAFLSKSFGVTSIRLRIGASSCRWLNLPSTIRCMSTSHTPFFVNGLRHPRIPTFLKCDSRLGGGGLVRAIAKMALTRHVMTQRSLRVTPMSITSI